MQVTKLLVNTIDKDSTEILMEETDIVILVKTEFGYRESKKNFHFGVLGI